MKMYPALLAISCGLLVGPGFGQESTEQPATTEVPKPAEKGPPDSHVTPIQPPLGSTPAPQNTKPGSELFIAAAEAQRRAKSITYHAKAYATGEMFESHSANIQCDVRMLRVSSSTNQTNGWLIRAIGSGTPKKDAEAINFDVAWTGTSIEFVNHAEKKVIEKRQPRDAKSQAYQVAVSSRNDELFSRNPFSKELAPAVEYEVKGKETVGGAECDIVVVNYGEKKSRSRWALATSDHLPRKVERLIEGTIANGTMVLELSNVEVDASDPPKLKPEMLKVDVPEGYQEDRLPKPPPDTAQTKPVPAAVVEPPTLVKPEIVPPPGDAPESSTAAPLAPATDTPPPPPPPQQATPFELRASTGGKVSLESLKGNVVVIEFGGSWCLPCRDSHNDLDTLLDRFSSRNVRVLALSCRDKAPDAWMDKFRQKNHRFPLLVEADAVAKAWNVHAYPTYFVVGLSGEIVRSISGYGKDRTLAAVGDAVESYLTAREPAKAISPEPPSLPAPAESPAPAEPAPAAEIPPK